MKTAVNLKNHQKKAIKNPWLIVFITFFLIFLVVYGIFFSSADVAISLSSRELSHTADVTANINTASLLPLKNAMHAYPLDVNESSSSSLTTTGTKDVGNNAAGTITIYNQQSVLIIVPKGTSFITNDANAYKFSLINDVSIPASQSQTGQLQAPSPGAQYNIPSSTSFAVNIPNVTATAATAFTGGSSTNAQTVAQADQDNLLKSLNEQLYSKGKDDLNSKIGSDMVGIPQSVGHQEVTKSFDSAVGDKASIVNLSLTMKVEELIYKKSDIEKLEKEILSLQLKEDESLQHLGIKSSFAGYKTSTGDITVHVIASAFAVPLIKQTPLTSTIAGKSKEEALKTIITINGVKSAKISINPWWISIFNHLPTRKNNIRFLISTK